MSCNMWSQTWRSPILSSILNISSCKLTWMSGTKHHLQSILLRTPSLLHVYVGWPQGNLQSFQAPPTCSTSWPLLPALCSVWHHSRWAGRVPGLSANLNDGRTLVALGRAPGWDGYQQKRWHFMGIEWGWTVWTNGESYLHHLPLPAKYLGFDGDWHFMEIWWDISNNYGYSNGSIWWWS